MGWGSGGLTFVMRLVDILEDGLCDEGEMKR